MDFFTVPTLRFQILYVFVVLSHSRRQVVHFGVTAHPMMAWVIQQLREAMPFGMQPSYIFRDNAGSEPVLVGTEIEELKTAYRSPWQNPLVERYTGTLRRELLNHVIILSEGHLKGLRRNSSRGITRSVSATAQPGRKRRRPSGRLAQLPAGLATQNRRGHRSGSSCPQESLRRGGVGYSLRGSSDLYAWVDSFLYLQRRRDQLTLSAEHRSAPGLGPLALELVETSRPGPHLRLASPLTLGTSPAENPLPAQILELLAESPKSQTVDKLQARLQVRNQRVVEALRQLSAALK